MTAISGLPRLRAAFAVLVVVIPPGCASSPRLLDQICKECDSVTISRNTTRETPAINFERCEKVVANLLKTDTDKAQCVRELRETCQTPGAADSLEFEIMLLIAAFSHDADREHLVDVLSIHAPDRVSLMIETEASLALEPPEKLKHAYGVLFEAYDRSSDTETRKQLATMVRRSLLIDEPDDNRLMAAAKTWYDSHRGSIEPDPDYYKYGVMRTPLHARRIKVFREPSQQQRKQG